MIKSPRRVVPRQPTPAKGRDNRLSPEELGLLAKRFAAASKPAEAAPIKERLTRGFYGTSACPPGQFPVS